MSDERKDDWESVLQAMRCGPIRHHIHDRELMVYWADRIGAAVRRKVYELESQLKKSMMLNEAWASAKPGVGVGVVTIEERQAAGNGAKIREALRLVKDAHWYDMTPALRENVVAALAAPARPCDKYGDATAAMAELKRRHHECAEEGHPCREGCAACGKEKCALVWLMTPEAGGAE